MNGAVERMLFAGLPHTPMLRRWPAARWRSGRPALTFAAFVAEVLAWVEWWNGEHTIAELGGQSPLASWTSDPSPVEDVDSAALWMFTLEDDRKTRKITTKGVARGRGRSYVADWMTGRAGTAVRLRYMPHHDHEVEVFDAATGAHLGAATLADQASAEQIKAVRAARARKARQLRADLVAAERSRRSRYAATTTAVPAQQLGAITAAEAARELAHADLDDLTPLSRPDLLPHPPPPAAGSCRLAPARQTPMPITKSARSCGDQLPEPRAWRSPTNAPTTIWGCPARTLWPPTRC